MEQRCHVSMVWLTWIGLPLLALVVGLRRGWPAASFVLLVGVIAQVVYVRWFPLISKALGYGSVDDVPAGAVTLASVPPKVTLYTASVCPFCPIVRQRLADLQRLHGFTIEEVDVTFRPEVIRGKGLRSVPVVEVDGRTIVGNATSAQLAELLGGAPLSTRS